MPTGTLFRSCLIILTVVGGCRGAGHGLARAEDQPGAAPAALTVPKLLHGGPVHAVLFAPGGRTLFSASADGTVSIWNVPAGNEAARLEGHEAGVKAMALAPDGRTLASGAEDGAVCIWDVAARKRVLRWQEGRHVGVNALCYSPDGTRLVVGHADGVIRALEATSLREVRHTQQDTSVQALAFSPRGDVLLCSAGVEGAVLRHPGTLAMIRQLRTGYVRALAFHPGGSRVALATDAIAAGLLETRGWGEAGKGPAHARVGGRHRGVFGVAFSPDGQRLASAGADGTIRIADLDERLPPRTLLHGQGRVLALAFSPDGNRLASAGADHAVRLWDVRTGREIAPGREAVGPLRDVVLDPVRGLALGLEANGGVRAWHLDSRVPAQAPPPLRGIPGPLARITRASESPVLAAVTRDGTCHLIDLAKNTPLREIATGVQGPEDVALSGDGTRLAVCGAGSRAGTWEVASGEKAFPLDLDGEPCSFLTFINAKILAGAGSSPRLRLWGDAGARASKVLNAHLGGTLALARSPDGTQLASAGKDRVIRIWEARSAQERQAVLSVPVWACTLAFAPGSRRLAVGDIQGTIYFWDLDEGREVHRARAHRGPVTALAFHDNGTTLLSAGRDGLLLAWDVKWLLRDGNARLVRLTAEQLGRLWEDLASGDAPTAGAAVQMLGRAPDQAAALLRGRVKPLAPGRLERLLEDLDHNEFQVRDRAMRELTRLGPGIEGALRKVLAKPPSLEVLIRVEELLQRISSDGPHPEYLRQLRALEVLELCGSAQAREVLQTLADGPADTELTRQARAALKRLHMGPG